MSRVVIVFLTIIIFICLTNVSCGETKTITDLIGNDGTAAELMETPRTKRIRHTLFSIWGLQALAFAFWVKVKLVIVSFIIGSAIFLGLRHIYPKHSCASEIISEAPYIRYDHGPAYYDHEHHETVPYSSDRVGQDSYQPYSAYSGSQTHRISRRSAPEHLETEEQIAEFMFLFLGLKSTACRNRFICEMEFRSSDNPLTRMAFRMVGRSLFEKYLNVRAGSFSECAAVNPDCTIVEEESDNSTDQTPIADDVEKNENHVTDDYDGSIAENINADNLEAERRNSRRKGIQSRHRLNLKRNKNSRRTKAN